MPASIGAPRASEVLADREDLLDLEALQRLEAGDLTHPEAKKTDATVAVEFIGGGWRARWVLAQQGGGHVVRGLTLAPVSETTPIGGVTTNLLRELSPQRALTAIADGVPPQLLELFASDAIEAGSQANPANAATGRPRISDDELAQVAEAYLIELATGRSGVTTRVRQKLGYAKDAAVRDRIRMCRERGWLLPTQQGRRGGGVGPALEAHRQRHREETS